MKQEPVVCACAILTIRNISHCIKRSTALSQQCKMIFYQMKNVLCYQIKETHCQRKIILNMMWELSCYHHKVHCYEWNNIFHIDQQYLVICGGKVNMREKDIVTIKACVCVCHYKSVIMKKSVLFLCDTIIIK